MSEKDNSQMPYLSEDESFASQKFWQRYFKPFLVLSAFGALSMLLPFCTHIFFDFLSKLVVVLGHSGGGEIPVPSLILMGLFIFSVASIVYFVLFFLEYSQNIYSICR